MKRYFILTICTFILLSGILLSKEKVRIGVFDSRAVAIWYFRSDANRQEMKKLMEEMKTAKEKKDSVQMKKIEAKGQLLQRIAHDKGFGRGSVAEILENYSKEITAIAETEKLSLIVSKWELNYSNSNVETVDITTSLLKALKAPDDVMKMLDDVNKNKPVENAFFIED
jgi:hypothetical protein